jgi:hypothetical protein
LTQIQLFFLVISTELLYLYQTNNQSILALFEYVGLI